jgi:L-alanine-DL-glutamate epimerase-like enolase superfamily enzyme
MLSALREALGFDVQIRIDANYGWSLATARSIIRELEDLKICTIEDPVLGYENMARLRQHTRIPFSTHEINLPRSVELGAPDAFVANVASLGGLRETMRFASACDVMGRLLGILRRLRCHDGGVPAPQRRTGLDGCRTSRWAGCSPTTSLSRTCAVPATTWFEFRRVPASG